MCSSTNIFGTLQSPWGADMACGRSLYRTIQTLREGHGGANRIVATSIHVLMKALVS
jgi:hypothetical protein